MTINLQDENYQRIFHKAIKKYRPYLDKDEVTSLMNESIWYASEHFNSNLSVFSTYLWNTSIYKCVKYLKNKTRYNQKIKLDRINSRKDGYFINYKYIDLILDLSEYEKKVLLHRYVYEFSLQEMSAIHNIPLESMRREIEKILNKIRKRNEY